MIADFYTNNRQKLADSLKGGVVILTSFSAMQKDNDSAYSFVPESNFWWLTGISEPDWWLIIDGSRHKSWLVSADSSDTNQLFNGGLSVAEAVKISGVDGVLTQDEALDMMGDLAKKHSIVYTVFEPKNVEYFDFVLNPALKKMRERLTRLFNGVCDCRRYIARLRAIKYACEITQIKKAIKLTIESFEAIKRNIADFKYEHEVEAEFTYNFLKSGSDGHAFDPIVASGSNACTLHYQKNHSKLKKRDLLLMDIGAKIGGYSADLTRTYSLGEPTRRQIEVHQAVNRARARIIDLIQPGLSLSDYQRGADLIMTEALTDLGLYNSIGDLREYFPHSIGHGLGVDTHDSLGGFAVLTPGMVLTVEPGIYIPSEGIGVRIEDDILVTELGRTNLSAKLDTEL